MAAFHVAVVGSAARHREVEIRAFQQTRGRRAFRREPAVERLQNALHQQRRLEHAAVEEHRGGMQEAGAFGLRALQSFEFGECRDLAAEKRGQMACNRGILRVRQAQLRQAGTRAAHRTRGAVHLREKALQNRLREFIAREFGTDRAADQFGAAARHDERYGIGGSVGEERLLGRAAGVGQRTQLPRIGLRALRGQFARYHVDQRQVHVVAAQQDMLAHCDAMQFEVALALDHGDQ